MPNRFSDPHVQQVSQLTITTSGIGRCVAQFALAAAYHSPIYKEPGVDSIDEIDNSIGAVSDVEDPLLTAHRLAKFYMISAGDALLSCCELIGRDTPMHVGSAGLARVTAEHSSKSMFLSERDIGWKVRVIRTHSLFQSALQEYKSSNEQGALQLIENWKQWRNRTSAIFANVGKQPAGSNRNLIEKYLPHFLAYDELSRPTHGNAVWLSLAVVQEQKGTAYTRFATLRNSQFAIDATLMAAERLCDLWAIDPQDVLNIMGSREAGYRDVRWPHIVDACAEIRDRIEQLTRVITVDGRPDPQPPR